MKENTKYKCVLSNSSEFEVNQRKHSNFKNKINEAGPIIRSIVITELVFILIFTTFLANCYVPTASMDPTIPESSRVIANRLAYNNTAPERFDIIAFKYPDHERIVYCKRIVGMPGEVLEVTNGVTYINGVQLGEEYIKNAFTGDYGPFYVPKSGDLVSYDDESNTATCNGYIVGDKTFIEKYCEIEDGNTTVKEDCYFCLGDNRDNSEDARFWNNKYVVKHKIVGKMMYNLTQLRAI